MADKITLSIEKRDINGSKVKHLRSQGIIPTNIFGNKVDSKSTQLPLKEFQKLYARAGETSVIYAKVGSSTKTVPLLISEVQAHPVTGDILHVDFQQVNLSEKIVASVPLELKGDSPAVEEKAAILFTSTNEFEVEALPQDLPEKIEVDITSLVEYGDTITVADLKKSDIYEIQADPDAVIVQVQEPQEEPQEDEVPELVEAAIVGEESVQTDSPELSESNESQ